ncbi:hypothetical protein RvY_14734 [Ramazzottius varieornatus]|uniref:Uncharacterized protein n=1 Tax=Ramazzottius varieornatus TaxID=947166 RepID=A0A1D1VSB6_RAMVA|nr:hypothetical protein RvY_14734 [Ramazzottius varieornatus]
MFSRISTTRPSRAARGGVGAMMNGHAAATDLSEIQLSSLYPAALNSLHTTDFNGGKLRKYVEGLSTGAGLSSFIDSLRQEQSQDSSALSADEGADIPDDTVEEDMEGFQNDIPFWENLMKSARNVYGSGCALEQIDEESDEDTGDTDDGMDVDGYQEEDVDGYQEEDKEETEVEIHVEPQDFTQLAIKTSTVSTTLALDLIRRSRMVEGKGKFSFFNEEKDEGITAVLNRLRIALDEIVPDKRRHQRGKYFRFLESVIDYKMETIKKYLYNDN